VVVKEAHDRSGKDEDKISMEPYPEKRNTIEID